MFKDIMSLTQSENVRRIRLGILFKVCETFFAAMPFGVLYLVLDYLFSLQQWSISYFLCLTLIVLLAIVGQYYFAVKSATATFISGYGMMCDFRLKLVDHLSRLPLGFFSKRRVGDLNAIVGENVRLVEELFTHILGELVASLSLPAFIAFILLVIDWRLGLAVIATVPVAFAVLFFVQGLFTRISSQRLSLEGEVAGRLLEYIDGIRVIRSYGLGGDKFDSLRNNLMKLYNLSVRFEAFGGIALVAFASLLEMGFICLMLVGLHYTLAGQLYASVFLMALVLSQKFYAPLMQAVVLLAECRYLKQTLKRIKTVLNEPILPEPAIAQSPEKFDVVFDDISFRYNVENDLVIHHVNLAIPQGKVTALVGPSGSGKTTLVHLLARFFDVSEGRILIGGVDIRNMSSEELLSHISIVLQDVYLFDDTIANNIRVGNPNASLEDVMDAAKDAQCHEFIMQLPQQYDTPVGEGGARLSGGEKQRISIARALLKKSSIVLLDESTASIDPESEYAFHQAFSRLIKNKTVIIIAHKLQTICHADHIVVLNHGHVAQQGTHDELMAIDGLYRHLWLNGK